MPLALRIIATLCGYVFLGWLTGFIPTGWYVLRQFLLVAILIMAVGYFAQALGLVTGLPPLGLK